MGEWVLILIEKYFIVSSNWRKNAWHCEEKLLVYWKYIKLKLIVFHMSYKFITELKVEKIKKQIVLWLVRYVGTNGSDVKRIIWGTFPPKHWKTETLENVLLTKPTQNLPNHSAARASQYDVKNRFISDWKAKQQNNNLWRFNCELS